MILVTLCFTLKMGMLSDDEAFTTEWELELARKKVKQFLVYVCCKETNFEANCVEKMGKEGRKSSRSVRKITRRKQYCNCQT